jgi:LCP family protein required for cell wall assembly
MVEQGSKRSGVSAGRRRVRTGLLVAAGVTALLVTAASGFGIASIRYLEKSLIKVDSGTGADASKGELPDVNPICTKHACNFLVLGSDTREGLGKGQQSKFGNTQTVQGQRSDTIMVVHVDASRDHTVILQIPRDLRVDIPGHGTDKINSAFNFGPNVTVQTVQQLTGWKINHYVEINFAGFERLVNALGGVPICIDKPLYDKLANLNLPHAGCYNLRGPQALAFVRARHVEGDTIPDFSRISRQQQFIRPVTIDGIDYVDAIQPAMDRLFRRIAEGKRLGSLGKEAPLTPISPGSISVQVLDAGSGGKVDDVIRYLQRAGFVVLPVAAAPPDLTRTQLLWAKRAPKEKTVVASYLPNVPILSDQAHTGGADVTVVIGPDFDGVGI